MTENQDERILWVGPQISWDAQWAHAVDLLHLGYSVWIHDHAPDDRCRLDGARCKCGRLTSGDDGPTLDLVVPLDSR